jgi:hypothetical protein
MHFNLPHTIATVFLLLLQLLLATEETHAWLCQAGGISEATTTTTTAATSRLHMIKPDGARESESQLLVALDNAGFSIFDSAVDLGFYIWKPTGECRSLETVVDPQEILASIDPSKLPDPMIDVSTLNSKITFPFYFSDLRKRPQLVKNTYPHAQHSVASLYVASKERGLELDTLDFCLGGSTLEILATQRIPNGEKHLVALLPGSSTRTVVVAKHKEYLQDYAVFGFQFERLVVGKPITALHDTKNNLEHLQVLEVSDRHNRRHRTGGSDTVRYKILISGNADGMDANGNPVEVKTNKPKYWGTKVMFQMISGASLTMCFGQNSYKRNGSQSIRFLSKIQLFSLEEVAAKALKNQSITRLETNICNGLETLKKAAINGELASEQVYEIGFSEQYGLQLQPSTESIYALFPRKQVVDALLKVQQSRCCDLIKDQIKDQIA